MNAISKRLLSWLCVIAMVLSFAPVMDLSGLAVKTQAAEEAAEIVYGSANFDGVDAAIIEQMNFGNGIDNSDENINAHIAAGTCPMCNATGITWTRKTAGFTFNDKEGETAHIYFDSEFTTTNNLVQMVNYPSDNDLDSKDGTICMALLSTAKVTCSKYRIQMGGTNNVLNIMGTGSIHADQSISAVSDLGLFQVDSGTVNLYGGTFTHAHQGTDFQKAVIRIGGTSAVVNIFDGVKIGPETQDTTKVAQNVQYTKAGTVNMFGGEIRNGVSPAWGYAGNVTITQNGKFNMYGGTISNGTFLSAATDGVTNNATIGGNVMVGGKSQAAYYNTDGSANYTCSGGTLNMYGGTITDGKANNGGNGGGNVCIYHGSGVMNMQGGTVSNGYAKQDGGNIQCVSGILNVSGTALITGGECKIDGGNIHLDHVSGTVNISGGKIADGEQTGSGSGGNIYVNKAKAFTLSGGIVDGGIAANNGANISIGADNTVHSFTGGTVQNGIAAKQGGGISSSADLTLSGTNFVDNIGRTGGGNVNMAAREKKLTITGGTISGGWVTGAWDETEQNYKPSGANWGGNVRSWATDVEITGGLIYGGARGPKKEANAGNNVAVLASVEKSSTTSLNGATLTIGGDAVIVGDINTSPASQNADGTATCPGTTVTLKGAPKIVTRYELADGSTVRATYGGLQMASNALGSVKADISELTADAKIVFTAVLGKTLSVADENAANIVAACSMSNSAHVVSVNDANELVVIEKPFEAPDKPEATIGGQNLSDDDWNTMVEAMEIQAKADKFKLDGNGMAECPVCGEVVQWQEATRPGQTDIRTMSRHYYIDADTEVGKTYNWYAVAGAKFDADGNATETTVVAEGVTMCLMLLNGNAAKNIGGMMGIRNSTKNCTFNIMGNGIITSDGSSTSDSQFGVVMMQGSENTVNLYGGTYIYTGDGEGRTKQADGSYLPNGTVTAAAINVKGDGNTVNMFDGVVIGPETQDLTKVNYNVRLELAKAKTVNTFNMYGGTIRNGVSNDLNTSGNLHLNYNSKYIQTKPTFNMYGGVIENGNYLQGEEIESVKLRGGNIHAGAGSQVNIYGGTISGGNANIGGNIYAIDSSLSRINLLGGTVTGGNAVTGGNFYCYTLSNISDYALIKDGTASDRGGNIYYFANALRASTISGGEICGGTAGNHGGNIAIIGTVSKTEGPEVTISGNAKIYGGEGKFGGNIYVADYADAIFAGGEIYGGASQTNGGNVYLNNHGDFVQQSGTKIYDGTCNTTGGGNVFVNTYCTFDMQGGEIYGGENLATGGNANAGNVLVQGLRKELDKDAQTEEFADAYFNMSGDAKIYGGKAYNQAGNIRVYIGTLTMTDDAMIYGGEAGDADTDNVWLVDGNLIMDGKSMVEGTADGAGSAVQGSVYRRGSNITLKGEASVSVQEGLETNGLIALTEGTHANYGTALQSKLYVDNGWTGTAYVRTPAYVAPGAAIEEIYGVCGSEVDGVFTKGGSFNGKLYYARLGNCPVTGVDGSLVLAANGVVKADGSSNWYATAAEALADYKHGVDQYVIISENATIDGDVVIDLAGQNLILSGKGTVYGLDSRNDGYEFYGTISLAEDAEIVFAGDARNPVNEYHYVALFNENVWSFHKVAMSLTHVTLRTDAAGVYYKASFACDELLASRINTFGTVLSLNDMPGSDFATAEDINIATEHSNFVLNEEGKMLVESDSVVGILKNGRSAEENQQIAEMKIYANLYLTVDHDGSQNYGICMGKAEDAEDVEENAYSLKDVLVAIDDAWDSYADADKATVKAFYETWKDLGVGAWASELESIVAYEPVPEEAPAPDAAPAE